VKAAAVIFDLFGTLLDVASLQAAVAGMTADPAAFVATWRDKQIAYAFASALMDRHEDFDALTAYALRFAAAKHRVPLDRGAERRLVAAWQNLRAFPDVVPALQALAARGVPCAVLTNGTPATAAAAVANAGLGGLLEAVLSVESAHTFKPDRRVYALATAHYGVTAERLVFVTSNGWDATGAAVFGLRVAWCNRSGAPAETFGPAPAWTIGDLRALAEIVAGG
jgi:2-haloacid dehalogenase